METHNLYQSFTRQRVAIHPSDVSQRRRAFDWTNVSMWSLSRIIRWNNSNIKEKEVIQGIKEYMEMIKEQTQNRKV